MLDHLNVEITPSTKKHSLPILDSTDQDSLDRYTLTPTTPLATAKIVTHDYSDTRKVIEVFTTYSGFRHELNIELKTTKQDKPQLIVTGTIFTGSENKTLNFYAVGKNSSRASQLQINHLTDQIIHKFRSGALKEVQQFLQYLQYSEENLVELRQLELIAKYPVSGKQFLTTPTNFIQLETNAQIAYAIKNSGVLIQVKDPPGGARRVLTIRKFPYSAFPGNLLTSLENAMFRLKSSDQTTREAGVDQLLSHLDDSVKVDLEQLGFDNPVLTNIKEVIEELKDTGIELEQSDDTTQIKQLILAVINGYEILTLRLPERNPADIKKISFIVSKQGDVCIDLYIEDEFGLRFRTKTSNRDELVDQLTGLVQQSSISNDQLLDFAFKHFHSATVIPFGVEFTAQQFNPVCLNALEVAYLLDQCSQIKAHKIKVQDINEPPATLVRFERADKIDVTFRLEPSIQGGTALKEIELERSALFSCVKRKKFIINLDLNDIEQDLTLMDLVIPLCSNYDSNGIEYKTRKNFRKLYKDLKDSIYYARM